MRAAGIALVGATWAATAFAAAPRLQETPAAPAAASELDSAARRELAVGDAPGGVDFRDLADVQKALLAIRASVAATDSATAPALYLQLRRQQELLTRQRDLLAERDRLAPLQAETSDAALAAAAAARDAARAALLRFDPNALVDHLRETTADEAVERQVLADHEAPAATAAAVAEAADLELAAATAEAESLPRRLADSRAAIRAASAELETLRSRGIAEVPASELRVLFEQSLAAEQELVHQRQRAAWLETLAPWLGRRVELLRARQQQATAHQSLAEASLAAARRHLQERHADAKRAAEMEVRQHEEALAGSADDHERRFHQEALVTSRLEAEQRAGAEALIELQERVMRAEQARAAAVAQRDGYVERYRSERRAGALGADPPADDATAVARAIDELQQQTRFFEHQAARAALRTELRAAEAAVEALAAAARARDAELQANRAEEPRWRELAATRRALEAQIAADNAARSAALRRLLDAEEATWAARNEALAILRSENLFLVEESEITRESLARSLDDLVALPAWALERAGAFARWTAGAGHALMLLFCLAGVLPVVALAVAARIWLRRHFNRLLTRDLASLPVRTALLLTQLGRCACTAAAFWLAPRVAAALLRDVPETAVELLHGLGDQIAVFWLGLGVVHELLHPDPQERLVLAVDRTTARRVGAAVLLLLWLSLGVALLELLLTRLGWSNVGGLAALDLAWKVAAGGLVVYVLLQRQLLLSLLPAPDRAIGRLLRRAAAVVHPILVLLVPAVVVLDASGYRILAAFITRLAVLSLAAFPIGSIAYQAVVFVIEAWRDRALAKLPASATGTGSGGAGAGSANAADDPDEHEQRRIHAIDEIARFLLRGVVIVLIGLALLQFTGTSFASLRRFFERPLPLQEATDPALRRTWWDVLSAALIAVLAIRIARHLKLALEALLLPLTQMARSTQYTITTLVVYLLHGFGFWLAATQLIDLENLGYLVAALSVGIGFGLQEIISNFVSGLILLIERPIKPGDTISLGDGSVGTVRELGIRATTIQTGDNIHILVPNREFITQRVVNHDAIDPRIRASIAIGVAYGSDVKRVRDVLLEVAAKDGRVLKRPAPEVTFAGFADSSLDFRLLVWLADSTLKARILSDLHFALDAAFARNAISIPFPHRDLTLRTDRPLDVALAREPTPPPAAPPPRPPGAD